MQLLRDGSGTHIGLQDLARRSHRKSRLLLRLAADASQRIIAVEQPGSCLDQESVGATVHEGREAELPRQYHRRTFDVEQQKHGAVSSVIGFAALSLPSSIPASVLKSRLLEHVPVVREHALLDDAYSIAGRHRGGTH